MATKKTAQIISLDAPEVIAEQEAPKAGPNQLALATKPAKPTKLRMNITQGKALVQEMLGLIKREKEARLVEMRQDLTYLTVLNKFMGEDPLAKAVRELQYVLRGSNINNLVSSYNESTAYVRTYQDTYGSTRSEKPYKQDSLPAFNGEHRLKQMENNFFFVYYKAQLAEMDKVYLTEDALFNRVMVSTINFVDANTLVQFQKQTIADLAPGLVRTVPSLDPNTSAELT